MRAVPRAAPRGVVWPWLAATRDIRSRVVVPAATGHRRGDDPGDLARGR
jgi:hypothetical protein